MMYKSHLIIAGATVTLTQPWHQGLLGMALIYALGLLGGLLPDVDHPKSFIGSRVPLLPTFLYKHGGHRGVTHSLLALTVVALLGVLIGGALGFSESSSVSWALAIGYASHLAADLITNKGIPACWPVARRFVIPVTKTGSVLERVISIGFFFAASAVALQAVLPWNSILVRIESAVPNLMVFLGVRVPTFLS